MAEANDEQREQRAKILQRNIDESKRLLEKKHARHDHSAGAEGDGTTQAEHQEMHQSVPPTRIGGPATGSGGGASHRQGGARSGLH